MATVNLGRIKPIFKGAYAGGTAYVVDDIVTSGNETFICIQAGTGNATSNASYWTKLAAKGTDGTNGTDVGTTITTQGDLLYRDGSGLQRLGAGTAGQVLQMNSGATAPEYGTLASNVEIINYSTIDSTGVNTITTTTNWATNNYWKIEVFAQYHLSSSQNVRMRFRNASGDITSDTYSFVGAQSYDTTSHGDNTMATYRDLNGSRTSINLNDWGWASGKISANFHMDIHKPDNNNRQSVKADYLGYDTQYFSTQRYQGWTSDTSVKTGFIIYGNGANLKDGFIITLGHKYQ